MQIEPNRAVALDYTLTLDDGIIADTSVGSEPLWYIHGRGHLLPQFESEVLGLGVGDDKQFRISAKDGYGERDESRVIRVEKQHMQDNTPLIPGETIGLRSRSGQEVEGRIVSVAKDHVMVDLNHALAGQALNFHITVKEIRQATPQELVHGYPFAQDAKEHVHGPNCNHH